MSHYKYLIVGGGMTADAAVQGIVEIDGTGDIGLVSEESDSPYDRPPLTKGLWKDKPFDSIWRETAKQKAHLHLGCRIEALDLPARKARDQQGKTYTFDKLLLATGAHPNRLPIGGNDIIYYRTVADYHRLRALAETKQRFAVIGGGFIGSGDCRGPGDAPEESVPALPRRRNLFANFSSRIVSVFERLLSRERR